MVEYRRSMVSRKQLDQAKRGTGFNFLS